MGDRGDPMDRWTGPMGWMDPKTGESLDDRDPDDHAAREQRLRNVEAAKRIRAGDTEGAMALLRGKCPP